jgi:hypothetical protein
MDKKITVSFCVLALILAPGFVASAAPTKKILFFTKSSGFEHSVISWKDGRPGYAEKVLLTLGEKNSWEFAFQEEWYSLKDFTPDIHVLTVIDAPAMKGIEYERPPYPTTWARKEGKGRVWFTAMGHREDVWTNPNFQNILVGGIKWALGEVNADVPPNLKETAPDAFTNPPYPEPKPATASQKAN